MWKIRSSVSNIQNVINLLIDYLSCRLSKECRELLKETNLEIWKLSRYIEKLRLLCLTTTDNENFEIKYDKIKAKDFIEDVILYFEPLIKTMQEKPEIDIKVEKEISFFSDYYICFMAISAIIYNALIYNKGKVRIIIEIDKKERDTKISVSDNGAGIKNRELEKIFSYGFSGSIEKNTSKSAGTELYLVRKLLNFIEGEIYFFSKENGGTRFEIIIKDRKDER